jgi:uncharacterized protein
MKIKLTLALVLVVLITPYCKQGREKNAAVGKSSVQQLNPVKQLPSIDIHKAALEGDLSLVITAIDGGIKPDTTDKDGRTPLMLASFNGYTEIIKALLKKGASVNQADNNGITALMMASSGPYPDAVKLLLDNNADPNAVDKKEHYSALMYAAAEGQVDCVKLLLAARADHLLKDIDGDDALTFARNNGHNEVVKLLQSLK